MNGLTKHNKRKQKENIKMQHVSTKYCSTYTCLLIDDLIYLVDFNFLLWRFYFEKEQYQMKIENGVYKHFGSTWEL